MNKIDIINRRQFGKTDTILLGAILFITYIQFDIFIGEQQLLSRFIIIYPIQFALILVIALRHSISIRRDSLVLSAIVSIFFLLRVNIDQSESLIRYLIFVLSLTIAVLTTSVARKEPEKTILIINLLIWMNVSAIFVQFTAGQFFGLQLDIHNLVFPFSRLSEISAIHGFGMTRFNGFQLEPGTYAVMVGLMTLISLGFRRKVCPVHMAAFLSLFLCRAASSLIYIAAIAVIGFVVTFPRRPFATSVLVPFIVMMCALVLIQTGFGDYLVTRVDAVASGGDGSTRIKLENLLFLVDANFVRQILGSGFMVNDCSQCDFINSNGVFFSLIFYLGLFGIIVASALFVNVGRKSTVCFTIIMTVLLSRLTLYHVALWTTVLICLEFTPRARVMEKKNTRVKVSHGN